MDGDPAAEEVDALTHAHEPESNRPVVGRNKTQPGIGDGEVERVVSSSQLHGRLPGAAVLDHVVQSFLHDSVETKRHLRWNGRRHTGIAKVNGDAVLVTDIAADGSDRSHQPEGFKFRRMKLV